MKFLKIILAFSLFCKVYSMEQLSDPMNNGLHKDLLERVVVHYVAEIPFIKEKHTNEDLLDFAQQTVNYGLNLSNNLLRRKHIASCQCVCKEWNTFIDKRMKNFAPLYAQLYINTHISPTSVLSYIVKNNLCDFNITEKFYLSLINETQRGTVQQIIKNFEKKEQKRVHILWGTSLHNNEKITTLLHCVIFPKKNIIDAPMNENIHLATYFLFTSKGETLLAETNRNENGDFTFKGFFSFLKELIEVAKIRQENNIPTLQEEEFKEQHEKIIYDLETDIKRIHKGGTYPDSILVYENEKEKSKGTSIRGTLIDHANGDMTEIVTVTIPTYTTSLAFFNAILNSKFMKNDGYTLTLYRGKDKIYTQEMQ